MSTVADSVLDEPVFARPDALPVSDDNGIGGEPALDASSEAAVQRCQTAAWLRRQWAEGASKGQFGAFAGICIVSGLVAVFCALARVSTFARIVVKTSFCIEILRCFHYRAFE